MRIALTDHTPKHKYMRVALKGLKAYSLITASVAVDFTVFLLQQAMSHCSVSSMRHVQVLAQPRI